MLSSQFESYRVFGGIICVISIYQIQLGYWVINPRGVLCLQLHCQQSVLLYLRLSNMRLAEVPPVSPDPTKIGLPK